MKIIHTGDLHIGSAFVGLPKERAALRKAELIDGFRRLCLYAKQSGVAAVLIAGDLFDENVLPAHIIREVSSAIEQAKPVCFFYVSGNHDGKADIGGMPDNFYSFGEEHGWKSYRLGENITLTGADAKNFSVAFSSLPVFSADTYNILLLHGDIASEIPLAALKNRGVDYLALGHIHQPTMTAERLDGRGRYRYCGCFEGRGFDEIGKRGCFLLNIEKGVLREEKFLSFALREVVERRVDISACHTYFDVEKRSIEALKGTRKEDIVKLVLCGGCEEGLRKDVSLLFERLAPHYFFVKIVDESRPSLDLDALALDRTERGEFIRECRRLNVDEALRAEIMEVGLKALLGEEIDV